jgi:hypothetical protein
MTLYVKRVCDHALYNRQFFSEMQWTNNKGQRQCVPTKIEYTCYNCKEIFVFEFKESIRRNSEYE